MIPIPGVPPLLAPINRVQNTIVQLKADAAIFMRYQSSRQKQTASVPFFAANATWGIYAKGKPLIEPDSIVSFDFRQEFRISDAPQEAGAFLSYNKVRSPFDVRLKMTKGGSDAVRKAFLDSVEALASSLDLCAVMTASKNYSDVNVVHYEYSQTAQNGVGMLTVEVWLQQVRTTPSQAFSTTKVLTQGTVQPKAAATTPALKVR